MSSPRRHSAKLEREYLEQEIHRLQSQSSVLGLEELTSNQGSSNATPDVPKSTWINGTGSRAAQLKWHPEIVLRRKYELLVQNGWVARIGSIR